jgi:glutamyl-tRNA synthetase
MVKVRIAPSPTGNLHIGTARTALFNWFFAKKSGGQFILRIEDTDLERSDKKYEKNIIDGLKWLGLEWDGEIEYQSKRLDTYKKYAKQLFDAGSAFWCHHTKEDLEKEKQAQLDRKEPPRHICEHKNTDRAKEKGQILRLNVSGKSSRKIEFDDMIRGKIQWDQDLLGDISIAKDFDIPLYNFAVVVDDIEMKITHVIRGEDHISNTPKQILIYEALKAKMPIFAHLPLILGKDKSKLSKRNGTVSIVDYQKDYLPEALVNFMGFLGYTYSKEIMSKEEMTEEFDIKKVHKSGAMFNVDKLNWLNAQYLRKLDFKLLRELSGVLKLPEAAMPLITERLERLSGVANFEYFWKTPEYKEDLLVWKKASNTETKNSLEDVQKIVEEHNFKDKAVLRKELDTAGEELKNRGLIYWPLRVALTGRKASPDPVDVAYVLEKEETLKRLSDAIKKL